MHPPLPGDKSAAFIGLIAGAVSILVVVYAIVQLTNRAFASHGTAAAQHGPPPAGAPAGQHAAPPAGSPPGQQAPPAAGAPAPAPH